MGSYHSPGRRTLRPYHPLGMYIAPFWVWPVPRLYSASFELFRITNPACVFFPVFSSTAATTLRRRATTCDDVRRRATTCDYAWTCTTPGVSFRRGLRRAKTSQGFKTQPCPRRATVHRLFPLGLWYSASSGEGREETVQTTA
jgi:hypothetical protein